MQTPENQKELENQSPQISPSEDNLRKDGKKKSSELSPRGRIARNNKNKGSSAERLFMNIFKELGFDKCKTTRNSSRLLDGCKVDLNFIPILLQIKAGYPKGLNAPEILKEMEELIAKNIPEGYPERKMPRIIVHHKNVGQGKKRNEYDTMVYMTFETFLFYFKKAHTDGL